MTAFENVELPLLLTHLSRKQRQQSAMTALRIVGLEGREDHYPRQLSGGQEQRVSIARAIVTDPYLIVADEPTGDLDRKSADEILELLGSLNREFQKTIVMVTHDPHGRPAGLADPPPRQGEAGRRRRPAPDRGRVMKFLGMVLRNARRNPIRSLLTIASLDGQPVPGDDPDLVLDDQRRGRAVGPGLQPDHRDELAGVRPAGPLRPGRRDRGDARGRRRPRPFSWYGGKYNEEVMPFAQFGVDPDDLLRDLRRADHPAPTSSRPGRTTRPAA